MPAALAFLAVGMNNTFAKIFGRGVGVSLECQKVDLRDIQQFFERVSDFITFNQLREVFGRRLNFCVESFADYLFTARLFEIW